MKVKQSGFTLIELMIVVGIIGIIAGIAYPSYLEQVRKSTRSDAKVLINEIAQRMQRCFTAQGTFQPAAGVCDVVDKATSSAGILSTEGYYRANLSTATADYTSSRYLIRVTPVAGKRQANDTQCNTFTLDQAGMRRSLSSGNADTTDICWK